jgi:hypothetical protein
MFFDRKQLVTVVRPRKLESISHPQVELGNLMDAYEKEAAEIMREILKYMEGKWPNT